MQPYGRQSGIRFINSDHASGAIVQHKWPRRALEAELRAVLRILQVGSGNVQLCVGIS
jgi:hypothetical protein